MLQGKITGLHISKSRVEVTEAEIARKKIEIIKAFSIDNIENFFNKSGQIISIALLVEFITTKLNGNGVTGDRLAIIFEDMFQTEANIIMAGKPKKSDRRKALSLPSFKKKEETGLSVGGATIKSVHSWGQYITEAEEQEAIFTTTAERDFVEALATAFSKNGYRVVSVESPECGLVYIRNAVEYDYDSLHKIIVWADNEESCELYTLTKDVPSEIKTIHLDEMDGRFSNNITSIVKDAVSKEKMRNPYVFFVGAAFNTRETYDAIKDELEEFDMGIQCFDLYGWNSDSRFIPSSVQLQISDAVKDEIGELSADYGMCICLLLRCYEKTPDNLYDAAKFPSLLNKKSKILLSRVLTGAAVLFLAGNLLMTGWVGYEKMTVENYTESAENVGGQLQSAENKRDTARTKLDALGTIDTRLEDVFNVAYENLGTTLNIASIDTADMLDYGDTQTVSAETPDTEGSAEQQPQQTAQAIIVRGYSTKSSGPAEFYNILAQQNLGAVKLLGDQKMELPSGEIIYAFEIQIGGEAA